MTAPRARLALVALPLLALLPACGDDGGGDDAAATEAGSGFPVSVEHKYGTTEIPEAPERVVSVGYNDQDTLLALGAVPVGIRDWYGDQPSATWPWAHDLLEGAEPEVLDSAELNAEAVAALRPDLIVGVSSGMTEEEYETLSQIAPTITQSGDFLDYGMPWQEGTRLVGEALGKADEAQRLVDETEAEIAAAREAHPEFEGATGTVSYVLSENEIGAYGPQDGRARLLTDLGFTIPERVVELAGDSFYSSFSFEQIDVLDEDLLVWIASEPGIAEQIKAHPLRQGLDAAREGREVFLSETEAGAASFGSVLSIPVLLETMVPKLAAAVDGDPATAVPET